MMTLEDRRVAQLRGRWHDELDGDVENVFVLGGHDSNLETCKKTKGKRKDVISILSEP
jgi:hypothetical protein